ncbi:MAG: hypothetical protein A2X12_02645 [Bacteroidetes bacterium GWE2_29_8]|nr:MAG: hypothetical protein A2X12_02645 [Bacteroidetes bacterium GWE2_29_8]OFY22208.1 MAG: hypothetical protein A2X02_00075 [Bacteroidetes bacterium GWF2_29_10]
MFFSCKKEVKDIDKTEYMGYDYFPYNIGHELIYEVDSTYYDDFDIIQKEKKFHFYIKEVIESYFQDNEGRQNIRIERYKRDKDTDNWSIKDVWSGVITNTSAQRFEEDERFVKLAFPIKETQSWNGNAYNNLNSQTYTYKDLFVDFNIDSELYSNTVTVNQAEDTSLIHRNIISEVYAPKIGMIYKTYNVVKKAVNGDIISGSIYEYKLISYNMGTE